MIELFLTYSEQGDDVATYKVLTPSFSYKLKDAGDCSWRVALSQLDIEDNPITEDQFAPKRSDYMLRASTDGGASFTNLQGGRVLNVELENDIGVIGCSGQDWLEYLDQPYPFDYSLTPATIGDNVDDVFRAFVTGAGTDTNNVKYNATQQKIINNILTAGSLLSDISYSAVFTGPGWTEVLQYMIEYLDSTSMLSHIKAIGNLSDPFGFDFWCRWNKEIRFYSPRFVVDPNSVSTLVDLSFGDECVVGVKWRNAGPRATRTVGQNGVGIWDESFYAPSISEFRDYLEIVELGEHFNYGKTQAEIQTAVNVATHAIGQKDRNPQKDLTLRVLPHLLIPGDEIAGYEQMIGKAISYNSLDEFAPYHQINADYWIVSQDYSTDDESGLYVLELGLQQIYPI